MADIYSRALAVLRDEHRATVSEMGWGCSCGKGTGGSLRPIGVWQAARTRHLRAEEVKILARLRAEG